MATGSTDFDGAFKKFSKKKKAAYVTRSNDIPVANRSTCWVIIFDSNCHFFA